MPEALRTNDDLSAIVLVRAIGCLPSEANNGIRVLLPLLSGMTLPTCLLDATCERICALALASSSATLLEELYDLVLSALQAGADDDAFDTVLGVAPAARLGVRLAGATTCETFSAALSLAACNLSLCGSAVLRTASLDVLIALFSEDGPLFNDLSASGATWDTLAAGCLATSRAVRFHCYQAACMLHTCLQRVWCKEQTHTTNASSPSQLLLIALERSEGEGGSPEAKAAAFIARSSFEGTPETLAVLDAYLDLHSALDSHDLHLITPFWPTDRHWWVGNETDPFNSRTAVAMPSLPPAWPWIKLLLRKVFVHPNVTVREWGMANLLTLLKCNHASGSAIDALVPGLRDVVPVDLPQQTARSASLPPPDFMADHVMPMLLNSTFRTDSDDNIAHLAPVAAGASPLAHAVRCGLPSYLDSLLVFDDTGATAAAFVEAILNACVSNPKQTVCEIIFAALVADARPARRGILRLPGLHLLRSFLEQAARTRGRIELARLWNFAVQILITLGHPADLGRLPVVTVLMKAPDHLGLLHPIEDNAPIAQAVSGSALAGELWGWLRTAGVADDSASCELAHSCKAYLDKFTRKILQPTVVGNEAVLPSSADLEESAYEARTLAVACDVIPASDKVRLILEPVCDHLSSVHRRAYVHPLTAPRLLSLFANLVPAFARPTKRPSDDMVETQARVRRAVFLGAEGVCGVAEACISTVLNPRLMTAESADAEWFLARAKYCMAAIAKVVAYFPDVTSVSDLFCDRLLPELSAGATMERSEVAAIPRRIAAASSLRALSTALVDADVTLSPKVLTSLKAAVTRILHAPWDDNLTLDATGAEREEGESSVDSSSYETARWAALGALLSITQSQPYDGLHHLTSSQSPDSSRSPLARLARTSSMLAGDVETMQSLLVCAHRLLPLAFRHGFAAKGDSGDAFGLIEIAHAALFDGFRRCAERPTCLQPRFCAAAAETLLSPECLSSECLRHGCQAVFTFFLGLGSTRPFAARLAVVRICRWLCAQDGITAPTAFAWVPQLHTLLLYGITPQRGASAVTALDDTDLGAPTSFMKDVTEARPGRPRANGRSVSNTVVDGCSAAVDAAVAEAAGQQALQEAVSAGGADAISRACGQKIRAYALRVLLELPSTNPARRFLSEVARMLLASAADPEAAFPKARLPYTPDARKLLRTWQALSILGLRLVDLEADTRDAASCVWFQLKCAKAHPGIRQYMEIFAVSLVLSDPHTAAGVLVAALSDASVSRDAASSGVLVVGAALGSLGEPHASAALRATIPHLAAWAASPFHTTRVLAHLVLYFIHTSGLAGFRPAVESNLSSDARARERGAGEEDQIPESIAVTELLNSLATFFGNQPQTSAAIAAAMPYLRLPIPSWTDAAALMDSRGTAIAAGVGNGESAPVPTAQEVSRVGASLVETWRAQEQQTEIESADRRLRGATGGHLLSSREGYDASGNGTPMQRKVMLGGLTGWGLDALLHDINSAAAAAASQEDRSQAAAPAQQALQVPPAAPSDAHQAFGTAEAPQMEGVGAETDDGDMPPRSLRQKAVASRRRAHDLIVVASLLDRPQNLGGICRTSEIFGVAALVLPDKRVVSHEAFKALSMGGERWLPMEEVKPKDLPRYLRARRAAGWRVVALEQARGSVPLHEYSGSVRDAMADESSQRRCRTVLLLGAEGKGVPAPLLSETDHCVEIPQRGLLRSLNVHVSAAIAVYEFALRHMADVGEAPATARTQYGCK